LNDNFVDIRHFHNPLGYLVETGYAQRVRGQPFYVNPGQAQQAVFLPRLTKDPNLPDQRPYLHENDGVIGLVDLYLNL
jgi:hypothetical protein